MSTFGICKGGPAAASGRSAKYEEDVRDGCGRGCGCESESCRGLEAEGCKEVSDVVDETRIGVELILPAGVRARPPVFALALHGNELEFVCANALSELVEYVRALGSRPPGVVAPPVKGPVAVRSNPRLMLLRLMKGRFATEEGSKSGIRVGNEVGLDGGGSALEVESSAVDEVDGCEEKDSEVEFAEVDVDAEEMGGRRGVGRVGVGVGRDC